MRDRNTALKNGTRRLPPVRPRPRPDLDKGPAAGERRSVTPLLTLNLTSILLNTNYKRHNSVPMSIAVTYSMTYATIKAL